MPRYRWHHTQQRYLNQFFVSRSKTTRPFLLIFDSRSPGNCPEQGFCNFDDGSLCEYANSKTEVLRWANRRGAAPNTGTGPYSDVSFNFVLTTKVWTCPLNSVSCLIEHTRHISRRLRSRGHLERSSRRQSKNDIRNHGSQVPAYVHSVLFHHERLLVHL